MDSGLGTCDAYIQLLIGEYHFSSRVVRNSLDPQFKQSFRISGAPRGAPPLQLVLQLFDWDRYEYVSDSPLQALQNKISTLWNLFDISIT